MAFHPSRTYSVGMFLSQDLPVRALSPANSAQRRERRHDAPQRCRYYPMEGRKASTEYIGHERPFRPMDDGGRRTSTPRVPRHEPRPGRIASASWPSWPRPWVPWPSPPWTPYYEVCPHLRSTFVHTFIGARRQECHSRWRPCDGRLATWLPPGLRSVNG